MFLHSSAYLRLTEDRKQSSQGQSDKNRRRCAVKRNRKILIVDDEAIIRTCAAHNLRQHGYLPILASNADEARELARLHSPQVILLDLRMPGIDGFELLSEFKCSTATAHIKVFIMSDFQEIGIMEQAFAIGADDYLSKAEHLSTIGADVERKLLRLAEAA